MHIGENIYLFGENIYFVEKIYISWRKYIFFGENINLNGENMYFKENIYI